MGSYRVGLSTTAGLATAILTDLQRGYDVSRLEEFPDAVNALTRDQVNSAIKKHLAPSRMVLTEAGSIPAAATPTQAKTAAPQKTVYLSARLQI